LTDGGGPWPSWRRIADGWRDNIVLVINTSPSVSSAVATLGERLAGWRERYPDARAVTPKHRSWQPCSPPTSYQSQHRYERHCTPSTFTSQKPSTRLVYYPKQPENSRQLSKF
jgi:hypothetical protein